MKKIHKLKKIKQAIKTFCLFLEKGYVTCVTYSNKEHSDNIYACNNMGARTWSFTIFSSVLTTKHISMSCRDYIAQIYYPCMPNLLFCTLDLLQSTKTYWCGMEFFNFDYIHLVQSACTAHPLSFFHACIPGSMPFSKMYWCSLADAWCD